MVLGKHEIEAALHAEKQDISAGRLKEDNPLDLSEGFRVLCDACRRGDLKVCQERIQAGININGRDRFDYTPLILASLCGHYEVVQLLLESGALCERDTFQGERCLYNALNDRIRNLLLQYDYSKSTDPLQPLAAHITSLLAREHPNTSDISLTTSDASFRLHKFLLAARSPYFAAKLSAAPETTTWRLPNTIPYESLDTVIRYVYLAEVAADLGDGEAEQAILTGIDKLSKQLEVENLFESILHSGDRRLARQRRTEEVSRGKDQLERWFEDHVLKHKVSIETSKADTVRWDRSNGIFADVLLRADEEAEENEDGMDDVSTPAVRRTDGPLNAIPVGPIGRASRSPSRTRQSRKSVLYPVHRAMLIRAEYFLTMFSSGFREAQETPYLQIIKMDCTPAVLEIILQYLYTETASIPLSLAIDVLFTADELFIDKLKAKAAMIISTLGNGDASIVESEKPRGETALDEIIDVYDVVRAGWDTRVQRLEEFGARYIAQRLERYIDEPEFAELVKESAARVKHRQETDTVELVDDIRYYLSERFRLRFEDAGLDEMMDETTDVENDKSPFDEMTVEPSFDQYSNGTAARLAPPSAKAADVSGGLLMNDEHAFAPDMDLLSGGAVRTLDGDVAGDEFAQDAMNYQILLGKIDRLLDSLRLDA